jgi:adenosine 3'-phospho 5'-phosphosulfate transporter B3
MISKKKIKKIFVLGVVMICSALMCDAIIGNVQEKSMKNHQASNTEVVLYSYSIGFVYLFFIMLFSGELQKGISFCSKVWIFFPLNDIIDDFR